MARRKNPQPDTDAGATEADAPFAESADQTESETFTADPTPGTEVEPVVEPVVDDRRADPPSITHAPRDSAPAPRQIGFLGPILGGALAAVGGFALAHYDLLGLDSTDSSAEIASLTAGIEEAKAQQANALAGIEAKIGALGDRVSALEAVPPPQAPDLSRLDGMDERLAALEAVPSDGTGSTAALSAKLAELERRLTEVSAAQPSTDIQDQISAALARLDAAEAAAATKAAEAEATVRAADRTKALDALAAAVADGRPFKAELEALADPTLSSALGTVAGSGVPSLSALQTDFPDAARAALRLSREIDGNDSWTERLGNFLASQTGARSITPREGDTADAILSRAEFAVSEGRVADALAELSPLDAAIKDPLTGWIASAETYVAATAALNAARGE
jgi:hypothetical protein